MFNEIVESVLNEISADDAYNKFYKDKFQYNDFKKLVDSYGKFDNLMKAVLKSMIENNDNFGLAFSFIKKYKEAPNEVRIEFNNRFKKGEYEDLLDMEQGLADIQENGVDTIKSFQEEGLVNIYYDERYLLTCTLTYEASKHYYGKNKWCTASDRFGRYDGWVYFLKYLFYDLSSQYDDDDDNFYLHIKENSTPDSILCQLTDKEENETYQFDYSGSDDFMNGIGTVCDSNDSPISVVQFVDDIIPQKILNVLNSKKEWLFNMQKEMFQKEFSYQISKEQYVDAKKSNIVDKNVEIAKKCVEERNKIVSDKISFVKDKFKELLNTNLLSNPEFIEQVRQTSRKLRSLYYETYRNDEMIEKLEKELKSVYYCFIADTSQINDEDRTYIYSIIPICGKIKEIDFDFYSFFEDAKNFSSLSSYEIGTLLTTPKLYNAFVMQNNMKAYTFDDSNRYLGDDDNPNVSIIARLDGGTVVEVKNIVK